MADGWVDETPSGCFPWEAAAPGVELVRAVADVDLDALSGDARVSLLKALSRLSGWVSVEMARSTMSVFDAVEEEVAKSRERGGPPHGWAVEEVAAALHVAPSTASGRLSAAHALVRRWPTLGDAVASGRLTWAQALAIAEEVAILDGHRDATGRDLSDVAVERVLPTAADYPPARLRQRLASLVVRLDPTAASRRRRRAARDGTDVGLWAGPDGLATLFVRGQAPDAVALHDAIQTRAAAMKARADERAKEAADTDGPDDDRDDGDGGREVARTIGQWRLAAVMAALGLEPRGMPPAPAPDAPPGTAASGAATAASGAAEFGVVACGSGPGQPVPAPVEVRVTVDIATLLGLADDPAVLDGYGPIDPDLARQLAADGQWVRWVTDPVTGYLLDAGTRRLPGTALARFVKAREQRCAHPSCGVRARHCDIDHVPEYRVTGHTRADQLTLTCPKHNRSRDAAGWSAKPAEWGDPSAGPEPTWTTPLGQRYRSLTDPVLPIATVPPGRVPAGHAPPAGPPDDDGDDPPF